MNIFDLPDLLVNKEIVTELVKNKKLRIEHIVSTGQVSDWYNQDESEFVILVKGNAQIEYENKEKVFLKEGDTLNIPAYEKHRVCFTSNNPPCVWICIFWRSD